ncbi:MAG: hypothetical protein BGO43_01150 [Gammaproteobacteria bacterium 39-13]|nr:hypothetical protein [Gammaproteobacteria bacterium]OJV92970.1 MAG: hypothetical protein BGO43_01150 [Gammaproteobacteria bacterium 39-13]
MSKRFSLNVLASIIILSNSVHANDDGGIFIIQPKYSYEASLPAEMTDETSLSVSLDESDSNEPTQAERNLHEYTKNRNYAKNRYTKPTEPLNELQRINDSLPTVENVLDRSLNP